MLLRKILIMKNTLTVLLFTLFALAVSAQSGKVTGRVMDVKNNAPLAYASVVLEGTTLGANTDTAGNFTINNVATGSYVLKVTGIGFLTYTQTIQVKAGQTVEVGVIGLKEDTQVLNEVVVENNKVNKFAKQSSVTVSKMPLKDIENPQVYNVISNSLLNEQIITNFDDALKNAPGIDKLWESTGRGNDGAGYFSLRGFAVQPTMVNGLPGLTNGSPDPANIQSIEVIKGPSGTLFGSSLISYGGLINVNTKKPFYAFGGNVSYTGGSYGLNRVAVDVNAPLSTEKRIAARVNVAYHTQNSFQDAGFRKSFFIAPSISYEVNDKLSFFVNTEFYNGKSTNQTMLFLDRSSPLRAHNMDELGYDHKRSYTGNDLYINTPTYSLQGQMQYKLSDKWTSQTSYSRSSAKSDGYYSYLYEVSSTVEALSGAPIPDGIILSRSTSNQNSETIGTDIQQNFIGEFNIGAVKNKLIVGLDYFNNEVINNSTGYGNQGFVYIGNNTDYFQAVAPALHAYYGTPMGNSYLDDTGVLTQDGADQGIALSSSPGASYSKSRQEIFSAYASDVVYILPQLSAMASLRVDRFSNDDYSQTAFSPKFGLVYQPILDKLSVFANYMDGFSNVGFQSDRINGQDVVRSFDPEHASQFEVGTKLNLFNGRLNATLSYYDIKVSDMVYSINLPDDDITDNIPADIINTQDGEQQSKGFEASIMANPIDGLNIVAGYSYNDSQLLAGSADFVGNRPESAGPQNMANLWASYQFKYGALNGFGLGFGGNYASENKIFNRNLGGEFALDEYTIYNASAFYGTDDFRITLKLDNIANTEYYKGWSTISPQNLRSVSAQFTYNF